MSNINLAWDNNGDTCYESQLGFPIPGYTFDPVYSIAQISHPEHYNKDGWYEMSDWMCQFYLEGMGNSPIAAALLDNIDFGIPATDTAEEMMQAVETLTPDDFARALAANGYKPDEE